jgi:hypothetical protein
MVGVLAVLEIVFLSTLVPFINKALGPKRMASHRHLRQSRHALRGLGMCTAPPPITAPSVSSGAWLTCVIYTFEAPKVFLSHCFQESGKITLGNAQPGNLCVYRSDHQGSLLPICVRSVSPNRSTHKHRKATASQSGPGKGIEQWAD